MYSDTDYCILNTEQYIVSVLVLVLLAEPPQLLLEWILPWQPMCAHFFINY